MQRDLYGPGIAAGQLEMIDRNFTVCYDNKVAQCLPCANGGKDIGRKGNITGCNRTSSQIFSISGRTEGPGRGKDIFPGFKWADESDSISDTAGFQ